jgi:ribosomal protein L37E
MIASTVERDSILSYFEGQMPDDHVVHLEKVAVERVGSMVHDIWDVHCEKSHWWAVTNPLNFYSQDDFKSRDVVLTFHVGLAVRVASRERVPITDTAAALLPNAWRLWYQAVEGMTTSREAEDFQAVGVRLRECMVTFVREVSDDDLVPEGMETPKQADVVGWSSLLADHLASGSSSEQLRSYLKKLSRETWDLVNKLTHAKNAGSYDAEIGVAAVSHFLSTFTAARMRWMSGNEQRCETCGSYRVEGGTCARCGWSDPHFQSTKLREISDEEMTDRLDQPHTLSSDIATFITLDDFP